MTDDPAALPGEKPGMFSVSIDYRIRTVIQAKSFSDALTKTHATISEMLDNAEYDYTAIKCEATVKRD